MSKTQVGKIVAKKRYGT